MYIEVVEIPLVKLIEDQLPLLAQGRHSDGKSLYFEVRKTGKGWLLRTPTSWMSLGDYPDVTLAEAREKAADARKLLKEGKDPIREKRRAEVAAKAALARQRRTVEEAVRDYWENKCQHLAKKEVWIRMHEIHTFPKIGRMPVEDLTAGDIVEVLRPIWLGSNQVQRGQTGYPTAKRVRDRLKLVLMREMATGSTVNPMICDVAKEILPSVEWEEKPHPALRWQEVPDLWMKLPDTIAGLGMRMCILTGLRVACVTWAKWDEIDWKEGLWIVPKGRVKGWEAGFRVPLTRAMLDVLEAAKKRTHNAEYIFASPDAWKRGVISENTWNSWLRENGWKDIYGDTVTAHGFRSTFRDWAAKHKWPRDLAEHSIQHVSAKGTKVERAYWREDRFEERQELIEAWNAFVVSKQDEARARERRLNQIAEPTSDRTVRDVEEWARQTADED